MTIDERKHTRRAAFKYGLAAAAYLVAPRFALAAIAPADAPPPTALERAGRMLDALKSSDARLRYYRTVVLLKDGSRAWLSHCVAAGRTPTSVTLRMSTGELGRRGIVVGARLHDTVGRVVLVRALDEVHMTPTDKLNITWTLSVLHQSC